MGKIRAKITVETDNQTRIKQHLMDCRPQIIADINSLLAVVQENKIKEIWKDSVDTYYQSYNLSIDEESGEPLYARNKSFYKAYETKIENNLLVLTAPSPEFYKFQHRADSDYIYDKMFGEGWHGGASHNGGMYYRKPHPYYRHWGRAASQTEAPYDLIQNKWDEYIESDEYNQIEMDISSAIISKYITQL